MSREELIMEITELEREIASLPEGSVTKKNIKGKDYYYHRVSRNGKRKETYISFELVAEIQSQIEKRKELEKRLKAYQKEFAAIASVDSKKNKQEERLHFRTIVRTGEYLSAQVATTKKFKKRESICKLRDYIFGEQQDKVFILYGLRRTGKTTMIRQILSELPATEFSKAAFIQVKNGDTLADVNSDMEALERLGYRYVFIDEITLMEDFIEGAALFSDIYASSGMKIVLSGTDSLGFVFTQEEQLYDRCIMLHTTFIPYREFENVLGIKGIDEYIRYGGTMSLGGVNYNTNTPFASAESAELYIDTAIAKNIQHSLQLYRYGGHFRQLLDLYEKGELTNVINRVIENMNHSFTRSVIEKTFRSHDILNKDKQTVEIEESHMVQIKEYLSLLDLIEEIDLESAPAVNRKGKMVVIAQPGLRYAQANAIVENMLADAQFMELSVNERQKVLTRLRSEICGRMMEEIVLLETKLANPKLHVFKLQFAVGEYDMVVFDPKKLNCKIYEVKHSAERVQDQYRYLKDESKNKMTTHLYGEIVGRYVIYRGEDVEMDGVQYLNVEEYLKGLGNK